MLRSKNNDPSHIFTVIQTMKNSRFSLTHIRLLVVLCAALSIGSAPAQLATHWATKPVRLVVPFAAGGPADVVARGIAQALAAEIKQTVLVENLGGAMGVPALGAVARAEPDGHTLLLAAFGNVVLQPMLSKSGGADLLDRLRPVGTVSTSPHVLVVSAKLPVKTVQELVDYARANPGKVSFASAGTGGTAHLGMEMFKSLSKTDVLHVPYKGSSAAVNDLVSGQVSAMFSSLPSLQGVVDKGYVRVVGATSASTSAATRSLPQLSASLPGFDYTTWYAIYAPLGTSAPLIDRISATLRKVLQNPELAAKIEPSGVELHPGSPNDVQAWTRRDAEKWSRIIREAKVTID
jgi:tripartite-type tricarboxylate transporter receptor subunit TctC